MMFLLPKSEATREVAVWLFVLLTFVVGVSIIFGRYEDAETHAPIVAISVFYVVAHVGLAIAVPTADTPTTRAFLFLYFVFNVAGGTQGALQETSNETLSPLNQQLRAIPHVANAGVFAVSLLFCLMRPSVGRNEPPAWENITLKPGNLSSTPAKIIEHAARLVSAGMPTSQGNQYRSMSDFPIMSHG